MADICGYVPDTRCGDIGYTNCYVRFEDSNEVDDQPEIICRNCGTHIGGNSVWDEDCDLALTEESQTRKQIADKEADEQELAELVDAVSG